MNVKVDEAGRDDEPLGVETLCIARRRLFGGYEAFDATTLNDEVHFFVDAVGGVDDASE